MIIDFVPTINFNYSKTGILLFETNIRYLGGMLSAYDLGSGPYTALMANAIAKEEFLTHSKSLAEILSIAFDTPTGIPENMLHFDGIQPAERRNISSIADIGTLTLEWIRLSDLLRDPKYTKHGSKGGELHFRPSPIVRGPISRFDHGQIEHYNW